jgi:hypothetical protein
MKFNTFKQKTTQRAVIEDLIVHVCPKLTVYSLFDTVQAPVTSRWYNNRRNKPKVII